MFTMVMQNSIGYLGCPFSGYSLNSRMGFFMGMAAGFAGIPMNYNYPLFGGYYSNYSYRMPSNPFAFKNCEFTNYETPTFRYIPSAGYLSTYQFPSFTGLPMPSQISASSSSSGSYSGSSTTVSGYDQNVLTDIKNSSLMKRVPKDRKERILAAVNSACNKYGVDPKLVISMMAAESGFDPQATSRCGAAGLMQLMPGTAKQYGASDPYNIEQNIEAAVKFIKYLKDRYNGNMDLMVAAYNAGPGRVKNSVPQIRETQNYVAKVKQNYSSLA